jgi:1,4-dihydroxy-2-naphthoyl-CoA synthase
VLPIYDIAVRVAQVGNARKPVFLSPRPAKVNARSPPSQRTLNYAFNLIDDGLVGRQVFAAKATRRPT